MSAERESLVFTSPHCLRAVPFCLRTLYVKEKHSQSLKENDPC